MNETLVTTAPCDLSFALGEHAEAVEQALAEMRTAEVVSRLWARDHTIWKPTPTEIVNRLGWLESPVAMRSHIAPMRVLAESVRADGYTYALLLGMGGSSLAPEVLRKILGVGTDSCDLAILDSTDPGAVLAATQQLDLSKTLFIVSTKSGGTVETLSFFKYAYNRVADALGVGRAGAHFIAITDPGSSLVAAADRYGFRETFLNDPNIGGRYSALSLFGLVPATLIGADVETLLARARHVATACRNPSVSDNPGAALGAAIGTLAQRGRDKLTFAITPAWASFGDWIEQLIAESTGKDGAGILPVIGETIGEPDAYGNDRVFVHLRLSGDVTHDAAMAALGDAGHPVIRLDVGDAGDLGGRVASGNQPVRSTRRGIGENPGTHNARGVPAGRAAAGIDTDLYRREYRGLDRRNGADSP